MTYPHTSYAITEIYCIVFALTIWFKLNSSIGSEHEIKQLRNMVLSYLFMLVCDIIWTFMQDDLLRLPVLLNAFINAVIIMSITCGSYFWFKFIEDRLNFSPENRKTVDRIIAVPVTVICLLDLVSMFTGWMFIIDSDNHYMETSLFTLQGIVNYFYLSVPTIYSIHHAIKTNSRQERSEYMTYSLYMIAPMIAGMLETFFPQVPLLALNIMMMILILFLMMQNNQVCNDALTGLNNRRRLNRYLELILPRVSAEHRMFLFIMDINSFKRINDVYGHVEGDAALKTFADVLRNASVKYNAFAARYGGDEFCFTMNAGEYTPEEVAEDIQDSLRKVQTDRNRTRKKGYELTVSIGYTICDGSISDPSSVLENADNMLYKNKKKWHVNKK
jgi:diguanylate cyclase (GGDEF)-like protein